MKVYGMRYKKNIMILMNKITNKVILIRKKIPQLNLLEEIL